MNTPRDRNRTGARRPGDVDLNPSAVTPDGVSVLVAEDDERMRDLIAAVLHDCADVSSVIEAGDGADAIRLGLQLRPALALLDLNMPRLDGVDVAITLTALVPSMRIALQSSDRRALHERAAGLDFPLFDKFDLDDLVNWARAEAAAATAAAAPHRTSTSTAPWHRRAAAPPPSPETEVGTTGSRPARRSQQGFVGPKFDCA